MASQVLGMIGPLLMGAQVGTVARRPGAAGVRPVRPGRCPGRAGDCRSSSPNIAQFEREWDLPRMEFRAWVALHEVAHRFAFAGPWAREHFLELVRDLVEHAEIDLSSLQPAPRGRWTCRTPSAHVAGDGGRRQPVRRGRRRASSACGSPACRRSSLAAEGYADHVMEAVGRTMLSSFGKIDEAVRRFREGRPGDQALEQLLGLQMTDEQHRLGRAFCRHGGRADRRGHAGPDVGLGRLAALDARAGGAHALAGANGLTRPPFSSILPTVPIGDLVFANVIDAASAGGARATWARASCTRGRSPGAPSRSTCVRAWKAPTGYVTEEIELITPRGMVAHRDRPGAAVHAGQHGPDAPSTTRVEDATFPRPAAYLASFLLEGEVVAQVEFEVVLQAGAGEAARGVRGRTEEVRRHLGRAAAAAKDGEGRAGHRRSPRGSPTRAARSTCCPSASPGPTEQTVPGVPGAGELVVITRRKGTNTSLERFIASGARPGGRRMGRRGQDVLVDRRRSRVGPPEESLERWRGACDIVELTPVVPA